MKKQNVFALAAGSAFAAALFSPLANAADAHFSAQPLSAGYQLAQADKKADGKCGEAKCGANKRLEKKAEANCGGKKADASCGADKAGGKKMDGSCGDKKMDASCGADKKPAEKKKDGKCGEAKCGANKK
ncbi:MAG: hypothetical protein LWW81_01105 [Rhodocyclales bacterium]|nr:hypothetical protein [Rhodocyclales bacterium]